MPPLPQPSLQTARLRLRPFVPEDAADVQRLAGDAEVASTTLNVPHPYADGMAEAWIATHEDGYVDDEVVTFAIVVRDDGDVDDARGELVGSIALRLELDDARADLGYWIGVPHWRHGYATEAVRAMIQYGFSTLRLHRIHAAHLTRNPASGRVMQKAGMRLEGVLRGHVLKYGVFEDLAKYGILRSDPRTDH
jgi:[ribosomal protein S5]-alanine N-acetyltransferase